MSLEQFSGRLLGPLVLGAFISMAAPPVAQGLLAKDALKTVKNKLDALGDKAKAMGASVLANLETGWNAVGAFTDPTGYLVSCFQGLGGSKYTLSGPCNGSERFCAKPYNQVVQLMTHNSMAALRYTWAPGFANHCSKMTKQLNDGVRGFMLDLHMDGNKPALCHSNCGAGKIDLVTGLKAFGQWLSANRDQVVTLNLESYITGAVFRKALHHADLEKYVYVHPSASSPWPTMAKLIETGKRLILFTSKDGGAFPGYHAVREFTSENHYSWKKESDFACTTRYSNQGAPYTLNHFLTDPVSAPHLARTANTRKSIVGHAKKCKAEKGPMPTFIAVDWYEIGAAIPAVKALNEF